MFEKISFTLFGLLIGSFLNAVIYRIPRKISISLPRSKCIKCNTLIKWYQNIPVLSYIFLKGRCSNCEVKISLKYPFVELISMVAAFILAPNSFSTFALIDFFFYYSIFCIFLVIIFIDIEFQIIPDSLNIYLSLLFLLYSIFNFPYTHWALGAVVGFSIPYVVTYVFYLLKGQQGLGGGDIKLYSALGILLGPIGIIYNIFFSCFVGAIIGGGLIITKVIDRNTHISFGPFIVVAAGIQIFFPDFFHDTVLKWFII